MDHIFEKKLPTLDEIKANQGVVGAVRDGGMSISVDLGIDDEDEYGLFVRLMSWDETKAHPHMMALLGKTVRVEIKVVED